MKIAIFGLGYVGAVSAACLAAEGHDVIGVDTNQAKVDLLNAGQTPVIEESVGELVAAGVDSGNLQATISASDAVRDADLVIVCVGTPSKSNGALDLTYVERVSSNIGAALNERNTYLPIALRSTVLPGSTRGVVIPAIEKASGERAGVKFGVSMHPEFLREGSAVADFHSPPKVVIGHANDERVADSVEQIGVRGDAPVFRCTLEVAELAKYVDNSWHATKVAFANEVGRIANQADVSSHDVMDIFTSDTKLNISANYLRPGQAFGGSCLPKDVRAINAHARSVDLELPLFGSILDSNQRHAEAALDLVLGLHGRTIAILGLSFKAGTDDMRESPMVDLAERLLGKGYELRVFDESINLARLTGANSDYINEHLPHIGRLMVDSLSEALIGADLVVVGNAGSGFADVLDGLHESQRFIDLAGVAVDRAGDSRYVGFSW